MIENDERKMQERQQQQMQEQNKLQQQQMEQRMIIENAKMEQEERFNQRDNDTKIIVAQINQSGNEDEDGIQEPEYSQEAKDKLMEDIRQFNERLSLDKDRLAFDKSKAKTDARLREKEINSRNKKTK